MDGDGEGEDMGGGFRDKDRMTTGSSSPSSESDYSMRQMRFDNPRMEEVSERPKSSPMEAGRIADMIVLTLGIVSRGMFIGRTGVLRSSICAVLPASSSDEEQRDGCCVSDA